MASPKISTFLNPCCGVSMHVVLWHLLPRQALVPALMIALSFPHLVDSSCNLVTVLPGSATVTNLKASHRIVSLT